MEKVVLLITDIYIFFILNNTEMSQTVPKLWNICSNHFDRLGAISVC